MYTAISVLIFIICVLLILIVLVQNSKGGGLASSFASSNQIMGVRKTTDFLEKATWTLAGGMMILCVLATFFIPRRKCSKICYPGTNRSSACSATNHPDFPDQSGSRRKCPGNRSCNTRRIIPLKLKIECQYVSHTDIFLLFCQTLFSPIFYLLSFFLYFSMIYIFFPPLPFCRIFFGTKYDKKEML